MGEYDDEVNEIVNQYATEKSDTSDELDKSDKLGTFMDVWELEFEIDFQKHYDEFKGGCKSSLYLFFTDERVAGTKVNQIFNKNIELNKAKQIWNISSTLESIENTYYEFDTECKRLLTNSRPTVSAKYYDKNKAIIRVKERFYTSLEDKAYQILTHTKAIYDGIDKCDYGTKENRSKNATNFQKMVVELLRWLFIGTLKKVPKDRIPEKQLKRDGVFETINPETSNKTFTDWDTIKFQTIFVECKNYKEPTWKDLMQLYGYTVASKVTNFTDKPICLLISRENPVKGNVAYKIRDEFMQLSTLGGNHLTVLFLDVNDLRQMVNIKKRNENPFNHVIDKLRMINDHLTVT